MAQQHMADIHVGLGAENGSTGRFSHSLLMTDMYGPAVRCSASIDILSKREPLFHG